MQKLFDYYIPEDIVHISNILLSYNHELRLVGGAVRDSLRGKQVLI